MTMFNSTRSQEWKELMAEEVPPEHTDAIYGRTGSHMELADFAESLGLTVQIDSENNEHSWILSGDNVIGEILGDSEAIIEEVIAYPREM